MLFVSALRAAVTTWLQTSVRRGLSGGWTQHCDGRTCPQANRCQPDDQAKPGRQTPAPRLELSGQGRVRIPAKPHPQAGQVAGHGAERHSEGDDNNDPLSLAQPVNPAHVLTLTGHSRCRGRVELVGQPLEAAGGVFDLGVGVSHDPYRWLMKG